MFLAENTPNGPASEEIRFLKEDNESFQQGIIHWRCTFRDQWLFIAGGGGKEGLEDLGGVEGGSVVVNRVQGGREFKKLTAKWLLMKG